MPKRGDRLPWQVRFEYPNGIKGVRACYSREEAEREATPIAWRGATVEIRNRDTGEVWPFEPPPREDEED